MTPRDRNVIFAVLIVALAVGGWLGVVGPKRSKASHLSSQINSVQSQLDQVRTQVAQDEAARSAFAGSYTVLAKLGEAVPADDNVPSLIYQLQNAATRSHVQFNSLALGNSAGGSSAPSSSTPSKPGSPPPTATLPPGATIGPAGFPIEPFSFTFTGNFFRLADFFGRLEKFVVVGRKQIAVSGRLLTLDSINLTAATGGFPNITATMAATSFLLPTNEGLTAGATPIGPQTASASSSTTITPAVITPSMP